MKSWLKEYKDFFQNRERMVDMSVFLVAQFFIFWFLKYNL